MHPLRIAALGLALAGSMAPAVAQEAPPDATASAPPARCDGRAARTPCAEEAGARPAPPPGRRAVPLTIERMPPAVAPVPAYRPAPPPPPPPPPLTPIPIPAPLPLTGCVGGVCRDAAGVRHEGGVGNATLDPNGRLCHRDGPWLQCF